MDARRAETNVFELLIKYVVGSVHYSLVRTSGGVKLIYQIPLMLEPIDEGKQDVLRWQSTRIAVVAKSKRRLLPETIYYQRLGYSNGFEQR